MEPVRVTSSHGTCSFAPRLRPAPETWRYSCQGARPRCGRTCSDAAPRHAWQPCERGPSKRGRRRRRGWMEPLRSRPTSCHGSCSFASSLRVGPEVCPCTSQAVCRCTGQDPPPCSGHSACHCSGQCACERGPSDRGRWRRRRCRRRRRGRMEPVRGRPTSGHRSCYLAPRLRVGPEACRCAGHAARRCPCCGQQPFLCCGHSASPCSDQEARRFSSQAPPLSGQDTCRSSRQAARHTSARGLSLCSDQALPPFGQGV